jgi:HSP20 family protein
MPGLIIWKDQEMGKLKKDIDRLFLRLCDDLGMNTLPSSFRDYPAFEQSENDDYLIFTINIPGVNPKDLDVSITEDFLNINGSAAKQSMNEDKNSYSENREVISFSRRIKLPCRAKVDDVNATYKDGILTIVIPKQRKEISHSFKIKVT